MSLEGATGTIVALPFFPLQGPIVQSSTGAPLILRRRLQPFSARYNRILFLGLVVMVLLPVALVAYLAAGNDSLWPALQESFREEPQLLLVAVLVPVVGLALWLTVRHERLVLSSTGIEYRSLFRGPLSFLRPLRPDWRIGWGEIQSAQLTVGHPLPRTAARQRHLVINRRHGETRNLQPYAWYVHPDEAGLTVGQIFNLKDEHYLEAVRRSPLYRTFTARCQLSEDADDPAAEGAPAGPGSLPGGTFDLLEDRGMLALLVGFFAVGAYAVVDWFFLRPWIYLEAPPASPFALAALLALALGATLGRGAPVLERASVALLFAAAVAAAVAPGLLRVNVATDSEAPRVHGYVSTAPGEFRPAADPRLPEVQFGGPDEYWRSIPKGDERDFQLARGELGFWQLDMRPIREEMRTHFQGAR